MLKVLTKAMQGELTKRQYDCMYAYYFENKTQAQIAKELGIGAPTVNKHMKKAKEEYRWNQWKAEEEKILREQGVDEETIQKLREYDWDDFNAERRFREHQTSLLDCMELLLEEKETKESQPESVEALLDTVENEELLQILLSTDKKTLQMIVLKMMGYAPKEISHHMELPEQTVYTRLRRLREKIKKSMKFE